MVYVDTNILIRLITNDVPSLRERSEEMIAEQQGKTLYIPDITFTELFFVLERSPRYLMKRQAVCAALRDLLRSSRFSYSKEADQAFLIAERLPKLDFTDCLLAVYAEDTNQLLTLDKELQKLLATSKG